MVYKSDTPTKDGRCRYYMCYKKDILGNNKKYKSKKYKTKTEAQEAERIFLTERDNPIKKKFSDIAELYFKDMATINKASSYQSYYYDYQKHLKPFLGDLDISCINIPKIREWHLEMDKKGLSVSFKNKVNTVLRNILFFAMKNYGLETNVADVYGRFKEKKDKVKEDKKLEYITLEEFNKFISVIEEPLWHSFFMTLFYTGCRKSEVFALTWNDINFDTKMISITKTLSRSNNKAYTITSTKNYENRKIKMNKSLIEELQEYKKEIMKYKNFSGDWFVFGNTTPLPRSTVDRYKHQYFELSGVHEITLHQFRHSAVTLLINEMLKQDNDLDVNKVLFTLSNRFGHTPEVMLKTYAHFYEDKLQDPVVDVLDNL